MSGRPLRLLNHQMAKAVAATATQAARTTTSRSNWRSRLRSNATIFEGLPLTATGLSDWVGMIAASPGESRSAAGLSRHPNPGARPLSMTTVREEEDGDNDH